MMHLTKRYKLSFVKFLVISAILRVTFFSNGVAQENVESICKFAESLYLKGNYDEAITEFYRTLYWGKEKALISSAHFGMGLCQRELNQWQKATQAFKKAQRFAANDSIRQEIKIANAATCIAAGKYNMAQIELLPIVFSSSIISTKKQAVLLLIVSAILQHDWQKAQNFFDQFQSLLADYHFVYDLKLTLTIALKHQYKSGKKSRWLSTVLPGLGQFYAKDYRNASNAFLLNTVNFTSTGWFIYCKDYYSAVLYFIFLTERYYAGNRYQAQQSALKYNKKIDRFYAEKLMLLISDKPPTFDSNSEIH